MFTLLTGFYKYMCRKDEFYILILGLDNAGKTTFLEQTKTKFNKNYKSMNLNKITATVGLNIGKINIGQCKLNFWDLGGQEELQSLWDKYYHEAHGVIYMVDSNDRERIENSKEAFKKMIQNGCLEGVPLLLVCNKQDVDGCLPVSDVKASFAEYKHLLGERPLKVIGASALSGDGVNDSIAWIVDKVQEQSSSRPPVQKSVTYG